MRDEIGSVKAEADQLAASYVRAASPFLATSNCTDAMYDRFASFSTLQSLNLPGALQAVERPIGLPPSLLGIAQDVRRERGAERVRKLMDSIATLRSRTDSSLNEVRLISLCPHSTRTRGLTLLLFTSPGQILDLLDQEAEEDETLRAKYSAGHWRRPLSHEVNGPLIAQIDLYRKTLQAAGESDAIVRQKWDQWEEKIEILGGDEVRVPSKQLVATRSCVDASEYSFAGLPRRIDPSLALWTVPDSYPVRPGTPRFPRKALRPLLCPRSHPRVCQGHIVARRRPVARPQRGQLDPALGRHGRGQGRVVRDAL